ncbi:hypothetical protein TL16_g02780 [Triparma laevis f. inornata]|uniref:Endonuclease/exonuclease/phosphatase domain-containing protein n=2 Tax=Triparma laevis TaxID=1534972 RepID=A0A9W6ZUW8_9STRA|nr:hypothetical protein TrLO_g10739 [Triparma laevis f. longispina]GMH59214.1 hypothetical protein TL16_g02780 [Triparma laevis f. inornata]
MSYNLLADLYTSQTSSPLWTYLDKKYLSIFYRLPNLINEIIDTEPNILLLQEVDSKHYRRYIKPILEYYGYVGFFGEKGGGQSEGLCSFFKGVEVCESSTLKFKDVYNCEIKKFINFDNNFKDIMYNKLGTICQVTEIRVMNVVVGIANIHLFYHPKADHIRLLQCKAVYEYVVKRDLNVFNWGGGDAEDSKKVKNLKPREFTIQQPMTLASGIHSFTNYAVGFIEQLDYIYVKGLKPMGYAECIERSVVEPFTAMPNERMGSDHLSVVCDVSIDDDDE